MDTSIENFSNKLEMNILLECKKLSEEALTKSNFDSLIYAAASLALLRISDAIKITNEQYKGG